VSSLKLTIIRFGAGLHVSGLEYVQLQARVHQSWTIEPGVRGSALTRSPSHRATYDAKYEPEYMINKWEVNESADIPMSTSQLKENAQSD
jgi:hypothetical protein